MSNKILTFTILGVVILIGFIVFMMNLGYERQYVDISEGIDAQEETCRIVKDKTWKTLRQKAGLLDKQAEAFERVKRLDISHLPVVNSKEDDRFVGVLNCRAVRRSLSAEVLSRQQKADSMAQV